MKKLFIAAMALATIVSCSKDDTSIVESSKKAVSISIANAVSDTRAVAATTPTPDGGTAIIAGQGDKVACADEKQLVVLMANKAGTIEHAFAIANATKLETGSYRFHNVNESVTQVAIVRSASVNTDTSADAEKYVYDIDPDNYIGNKLSDYSANAGNENSHEQVDLAGMDLYVAKDLGNKPDGTCTISDPTHNKEWTYQLYNVELTVAPALARIEITTIGCNVSECVSTDHDSKHVSHVLGGTTLAAAQGQSVSGGYDELALKTIEWGTNDAKYSYTFVHSDSQKDTLKGIYAGSGNKTARNITNYFPGGTVDAKQAIVWNIAPTAAVPYTTKNPMILTMDASAYDYTVVNNPKTLTIGFDNDDDVKDGFKAGNIYRLAINFGENNLDETNEAICVDVKVTIANWVITTLDPTFGAN